MRSILIFALTASFVNGVDIADDTIGQGIAVDGANNTVEARADPLWPGYFQCQQRDFGKPCTWKPTGGQGALDCHRMEYSKGSTNPDTSFGPDAGVTCKVYGGTKCESTTPLLLVNSPGGNLLTMGRDANLFPPDTVEGFFSFRCRSWKQKDPDNAEQTRFIPLPAKP